jgi:NAD(P)-dependent dehydrogenase (short-subunit alcohol dehydrogenase family)
MPTWLVTGANRGIGLAFARTLSRRGVSVVGTARRPERADELRETGARVEPLDVGDDASVAALARSLEGEALDVLVLNPAIGEEGPGVDGLVAAEVERTLNVGAVRVTRALLPNLRAGKPARSWRLRVIDGLRPSDSGRFFDRRGRDVPW